MSLLDRARGSLRGRLALSLATGAVIVLSLSFVALHMVIRGELYGRLEEDLALRMRGVADYAVAHPGSEGVTEYMPQFRARAHQDFFQIWDGSGRVLARSDSSIGRDLPRLESEVGSPLYHDLTLPDGHHGRAISQRFNLPADDARRTLTVVTAREIENLEHLESRIHFMLLFAAVLTIAALLVITRYSVRRGLKPVDDFVLSLERVDLDDPGTALNAGPLPSELRPAAASFSALLHRLLEALARERRYARNVAHELRNPLAEMRLLADVGSTSKDPGAVQAVIRDIGATAAEMEQIVESLLALTRYEAGLEAPQPEPVDLSAVLRRQVDAAAASAELRSLAIALDVPGEVWVYTDSALVHRLLVNLLGNAISHAPRGSTVRLTLSPNGDLTLANPAPQLSSADLPRLGERFFRIDTGNGGSHAGLGLSLAVAVARVLRLSFGLTLREDGYLVATVSGFRALPQAPATDDD